jgi:hypothetical protein
MRVNLVRIFGGTALGSALGTCWLLGDGLVGPAASFLLLPLIANQQRPIRRLLAAMGYYTTGSLPAVAAVVGYWGADHASLGVAAWFGSALLLSIPWTLADRPPRASAALALTALPPLGVIGWLSPLNAAGVFFPGLNAVGLGLLLLAFTSMHRRAIRPHIAILTVCVLTAVISNLLYLEPAPPAGWLGIHTHVSPSRGDRLKAIQSNQDAIDAALTQGKSARVVVFAEAILDDWLPGTRQQLAMAAPSDQIWILGAQVGSLDAVVAIEREYVNAEPVSASAGLLLGGDWIPWSRQTLTPAWWEPVFRADGRRIWPALCIEQVQPWTWLEAMWQRPDVILAMSNGWWASGPGVLQPRLGEAGLAIERASTRAWARLMGLPVVWAGNR